MDKIELREKIHRTTSLLARRIVAEASKKSISGDMIVRFNNEADNELLVLTDQHKEQHYNPNCPQCYENLLKSGVPEQIRKEERERIKNWLFRPCPHTGGLEEEQLYTQDCPKCWQALSQEEE